MNSEEHRRFLESIKQSQQQSKRVLARLEGTLSGVRTTLSEIQETTSKYDKMKEDYNKAMEKLALNLSNAFGNPLRRSGPEDQRPKPTKIPMQKAVEEMMKHSNVLFVTGAGVSADSGIPTFRGQNGLYSKKFNVDGIQLDPEAFINKQFFNHRPKLIWDWIQTLQQSVSKSKPNKTHYLIHQCLLELSKKGKKPVLVTQNVDDLHLKPENKQYEYHAIHGVANQMRCCNLHYQPYDYKKVDDKCPQCNESLRPHIMFFDQSYGVPFGKDVKDRQFQFVVIIGSSLNTGLCIRLASQAKYKIEINPHPVIEVGSDTHPFSEDTNKTLEQMLRCIKKY